MTEVSALSRFPRNVKNNATNKNYPLTEENLKLHTGMVPSSRETKTHFVLIYVDLQKQLVALEAQLRKETEAAQEKFNASLPENTPPVIPEVIHVPQLSNSTSPTSVAIDDEEPISLFSTNAISTESEPISPRSIEEIPSLLDSVIKNGRKSQRIKNLFKKTAKKITTVIGNPPNNDSNDLATHFDIASLKVELSVPPSPSQSTVRSKNSLSRPKTPIKNIFISQSSNPTHNRTDSADTMLSTHPSSSVNNNAAYSSTQQTPPLPSPSPNTNTNLNFEKKNDLSSNLPSFINNSSPPSKNEKCENDNCKASPDHRDSGISLVSPRRSGHHSREHSISSILRKVNFNAFQKDNQHQCDSPRREKSWGPFPSIIGSKDNDVELLAFRYPSTHIYTDNVEFGGMEEQDNSSSSGGAFVSEFDETIGKQKDKERSVTFDLDDQQVSTSDEETGLNKRKICSVMSKNVHSTIIPIDASDDVKRGNKEVDELNILRATDIEESKIKN